ncbi:bifunctional adenosylcobinamide kinase/adenosylcobinamide-phosphate guanylyltransferase [Desulfonatronovibrio magnus]|uniref:bifunctional adenosylcobinamide kinase/adenosylcobinamide-phosphate guanylyltransferase n=1 Tax=Desulfonatronovibrio magnus TaxID=698827 RepID=UPI0005EB2A5C|nr:bifunctional adenosylcobinamide kinase/adenosylcobinamide-phosphate guanylyltransferase [Desulfonatronovibrio magnus]RQD65478.1 MAG: cobalbumin biosynthesis protein [Desulfonatronovibrio sp. MSAO_Bac4]
MFSLVLGGNKSGKSDFALELMRGGKSTGTIIVTGKADDLDFNDQIRHHKINRDPAVPVIESDMDLGGVLESLSDFSGPILIDSIDFWVFSIFSEHQDKHYAYFFNVLKDLEKKRIIFVSAEISLGPLPASSMVRNFARKLGMINQRLAAISQELFLVVAGQPLKIK